MLDVEKNQSVNEVIITGVLKELDVRDGETSDGRKWVSSVAKIGCDQEINGVMTENVIPVHSFAMRKKSDGTDNKMYDNIMNMRENYISEASAEDGITPTRLTFAGRTCNIGENVYVNREGRTVDGVFQINCNFPRTARAEDVETAEFTLSGVVGSIKPEYNGDDETGRLKVKMIIVNYNGKVDVVELIAEAGSAANFIEQNWHEQDTVNLTGKINMSFKVEERKIEQAFGAPQVKKHTVSKNELVITGGSYPLDEDESYDAGQIKIALGERQARIKQIEEKSKKPKAAPSRPAGNVSDFGF